MEIEIINQDGKQKGKISLPGIFDAKVSTALLHEVTTAYMAGQRQGTHSTKTRGEVSGGGHKVWRQKGTGRARAGSNRSPLWRKGGIIFGPSPRDYSQKISQSKRRSALAMALSAKAANGDLIVLDSISMNEPKTKLMAGVLEKLKLSGQKVLVVSDKPERNLKIAGRNIEGLVIQTAAAVNTYEVLWAKKIILTAAAVEQLDKTRKN